MNPIILIVALVVGMLCWVAWKLRSYWQIRQGCKLWIEQSYYTDTMTLHGGSGVCLSVDELEEICRAVALDPTGHTEHHFPANTREGTLERTPGFISMSEIPGREGEIFCVGFSWDKDGIKTYLNGERVEPESEDKS